MEALTAVSIALLTVHDTVKAIDRGMYIEGIRLISKKGWRVRSVEFAVKSYTLTRAHISAAND